MVRGVYVPAAGNARSSADTGDFHCPTFQEGVPVSQRFAASQMDSVPCGGCIAWRRDQSRVCLK